MKNKHDPDTKVSDPIPDQLKNQNSFTFCSISFKLPDSKPKTEEFYLSESGPFTYQLHYFQNGDYNAILSWRYFKIGNLPNSN